MYGQDGMVTRDVIALAVRRAKTPVCWFVNRSIGEEELDRLARLSVAFLIDWRIMAQTEMQSLLAMIHHDYPHHLIFIDARRMREEERRTFLAVLGHAEIHGSIVPDISHTFIKKCCATGRFIFFALPATISPEAFPEKIGGLLGKSRFNHRGRKNVGGMVDTGHAPMFSRLEEYARELPLFVSCTPSDWHTYSFVMQGAVMVAPGMRFIGLPVPPSNGDDAWRDESSTAARQLADALQCAIAATR